MLTFLITAIAFLAGTAGLVFVALFTVQEGQIFGAWQNVLSRLRNSRKASLRFIAKPLGDCEMCFAHLFAMLSFVCFVVFMKSLFGYWPTMNIDSWLLTIFLNLIIYFLYVPTSTVLSMLTIKLFQK